ncbi:hypothetical protein IKG64_00875 [Candidatus Saccharibacteria bacterium]|nr:hypothetical protein [Candidatus Saccharibacteria bacterium]
MKTNLANTIRKLSSRISTGNKRRSPANGSNTSSVGGVTSLILPALLLLAVFVANGVSVYATTSSITLTIDDATVDMNAISTNANGSFFKSGDSTISATTNNATGYTLKVIATSSSNYNKLINSSDSNAVLTSITSAVIEDDFKNSANTTYNGKWGYLPSKLNSVANTSFQPAPSDVGDTLDITSAANNTANTYTLAIGARIDSSVKIGEYSNTYNVVMVANAIPYTISYEGNVATNMPTNTSGTTESSTITLSSNTPVRSGYEFLGWCDGTVTTANNTDSCSGTTYAAGGTYTLDGTTTNNISLTAMWEMPFCGAHTCMQDLTSSTIATLLPSTGSTATVYDSRDQQQYTIAKLLDGKYWMTTNLNLAGGTALSADDTDVTSTYISGFTTQGNLTKSGNTIVLPTSSPTGTSVSGYYTDDTMAYVTNSGNNTTTCNSSTPCNSYYSWIAATLGGKQADGSTAQTSTGYNAAASICPKGWRLPTSTTSNANATTNNNWKTGDWYALATAYGANLESSRIQNDATFYKKAGPGTTPNFLLAGEYNLGSFYNGGSNGSYWSSTAGSSTNAFHLWFHSGYVDSAYSTNRRLGFSVRCVYGS